VQCSQGLGKKLCESSNYGGEFDNEARIQLSEYLTNKRRQGFGRHIRRKLIWGTMSWRRWRKDWRAGEKDRSAQGWSLGWSKGLFFCTVSCLDRSLHSSVVASALSGAVLNAVVRTQYHHVGSTRPGVVPPTPTPTRPMLMRRPRFQFRSRTDICLPCRGHEWPMLPVLSIFLLPTRSALG
jgi:hypothetical protein